MKYCPEHGNYVDACPGCGKKLADKVEWLELRNTALTTKLNGSEGLVWHKYIAIVDNGHGTRSWTVLAEDTAKAKQRALLEKKATERLVTIALITWEDE